MTGMRNYLTGATMALLMLLSACGSNEPPTQPEESAAVEGDVDTTDSPSPTESAAAAPETNVTTCEIKDGLPVAEVKVTNTTDQASAFSVEVQFFESPRVSWRLGYLDPAPVRTGFSG
jgi:hypothetical protein